MERLTWRNKKGLAFFDDDGVLIRGANGTFHQKKDMTAHYIHDRFVALDKTIDRLAAYEDTGLEPEEIEELLHKKLGEWISAEKEGRLAILPCSVGDTVYVIAKCSWVKRSLDGTMYGANGAIGTATGYYCVFEGCEDDCPLAAGRDTCDQNGYAVFEEVVDFVGANCYPETEEIDLIVKTENLHQFLGDQVYLSRAAAEAALKQQGGADT